MITPEQIAAGGTETSHQQALFAWAALQRATYPQLKWLHAIPNANSHHQVAEGVRGGVPDICLPWPVKPFHGLYIELKLPSRRKHKNGGASDVQLEWLAYLSYEGYMTHLCYGWEHARDAILDYIGRKQE